MKKLFKMVALLFIAIPALGQDEITLFGVKFKASEILGTSKSEFTYSQADGKTKLLKDPNSALSRYEFIGGVYSIANFKNVKPFFTLYSVTPMPILDSIEYEYYSVFTLSELTEKYLNTSDYTSMYKFDSIFRAQPNNKERKKILYKPQYVLYRKMLEASKYVMRDSTKIDNSTKLVSAFTASLSASLIGQLTKTVSLSAETKNSIQKSIEKSTTLNVAYSGVGLDSRYIGIAGKILKYYSSNRPALEKYSDSFAEQLKKYLDLKEVGIISGSAILEMDVKYEALKNIELAVNAVISADANISKPQKDILFKASGTSLLGFFREKNQTTTIVIPKKIFYIRYAYDNALELGNGGY